jgi:GNAT superfamily N-acetyltransferase
MVAEILISTDKHRLDVDFVHAYLSGESYWAKGRSRAVTEKAIANSLCFGVYDGDLQIGFARVVTDFATFGWLADVFIDETYRGRGLGKRLIEAVINHEDLLNIKRLLLATRDAHELYRRYGGFEPLSSPERWMSRQKES